MCSVVVEENTYMCCFIEERGKLHAFFRSSASLCLHRCHRLTYDVTFSFFTISSLFVDRFWRSVRFCRLILIRKPFIMVRGVKMLSIGGGFLILSNFRELFELLWMLSSLFYIKIIILFLIFFSLVSCEVIL